MILKLLSLGLFAVAAPLVFAVEEAPDPCTLLTPAQLEATFGKLKGTSRPDIGLQKERECHYENEEGNWLVLRIYPYN